MEIYANKIPKEIKQDVATVAQRVRANKLRADTEDVKYLFDIYHEYLAPYDQQNINCKACRSKVCGIFFQILRVWTNES